MRIVGTEHKKYQTVYLFLPKYLILPKLIDFLGQISHTTTKSLFNTSASTHGGVSVAVHVCSPGEIWSEENKQDLRVRERQNKKEMHGQTGLKWQQSNLMETDGRMRR